MHPVVYERGEGVLVGVLGVPAIADTFVLEVATICDLFDCQYECGHSRADPEYYGTVAELGEFVAIGVTYPSEQEGVVGEICWPVATLRGIRRRGYHEHAIGDPKRVTFFRGADPVYARASPLSCWARRSVW